jgi:hypothetical protein
MHPVERVVPNALVDLGGLAAIILPPASENPIPLLAACRAIPAKATGAPEKLIPRRPALGLSVAQPNPSGSKLCAIRSLRKHVNQIVGLHFVELLL